MLYKQLIFLIQFFFIEIYFFVSQGGYPGYNPAQQPGYYGGGGGAGGGGYPPSAGGYGAPPQPSGIPGISPDVERMFNAVDTDRSGKITGKELQSALQNGKGENFSDKCCQLMVCKCLESIKFI